MKKYKQSIILNIIILVVCFITLVTSIWGWFAIYSGNNGVGGFVVEVTDAKTSLEFIIDGYPHDDDNLVLPEAFPGKVYNFILKITNITDEALSLNGAYINPTYSFINGESDAPIITKVFVTQIDSIEIVQKVNELENVLYTVADLGKNPIAGVINPTEWTLFSNLKIFDTNDYVLKRDEDTTEKTLILLPNETLKLGYKLFFSDTLESESFRNSCQGMLFQISKLAIKSEIVNGEN